MRNKQFYTHEICRPARTRYMRKLEPYEYQLPRWLERFLYFALAGGIFLVFN